MNVRKEMKTERLTIRCTPSEKNYLEEHASQLGMHAATYAHDLIFKKNQRRVYVKRKISQAFVRTGYYLDEMYDIISKTDSDYIAIEKILPPLNNARKECDLKCIR